MIDLKPCPFCGGEAKVFACDNGGICVKCMECCCQTQASTDFCISHAKVESAFEKIVSEWNRRV